MGLNEVELPGWPLKPSRSEVGCSGARSYASISASVGICRILSWGLYRASDPEGEFLTAPARYT